MELGPAQRLLAEQPLNIQGLSPLHSLPGLTEPAATSGDGATSHNKLTHNEELLCSPFAL